ncbi:MAG: TonB-dependent receptor [Bacteroidota bacterium]
MPLILSAQDRFSISGQVIDNETKDVLIGATVQILQTDSSFVKGQITNANGDFNISNLKNDYYIILIRSLGYKIYTQTIDLNADRNLGAISLIVDPNRLDEVVVEAQTQTAIIKGDTVQYLSSSYKTNPDATAEDLLSKLPGVIVIDGEVEAQGEQVRRVLVDGKEFFSNDPTLAIKNIPAEVIQKIEVFDQLSEQSQFTGFDDGNTTKTINIVTKPEARNGQFGRVYAGSDFLDKYNAGGNINDFKEDQRLSILGLANNVNIQNFSSEDLVGVSSSGGGRGAGRRGSRGSGRGGGGGNRNQNNANQFLTGQQNGINTIESVGINYSDDIGDKLSLTTSYFFNHSNTQQEELLTQQFFLTDSDDQIYDEVNSTTRDNYNHRFNLRANYKITDRTSVLILPQISFQDNVSNSIIDGSFLSESGEFISSTANNSIQDAQGIRFSNNLMLRHRFAKQGRTISVSFRTNANTNEREADLNADNVFENGRITTTTQTSQIDVATRSYNTSLRFTEMISQGLLFQLGLNRNQSMSDSNRETFDIESDESQILNPSLSNVFESTYITSAVNGGFMYRKGAVFSRVGVAYENAELSGETTYPSTSTIRRTFNNVLPIAIFNYRFDRKKNLRFIYRTNTNEPSVTDLQEVVDNGNPLSLTIGNNDLRQSYSHTLVTRYSTINTEKGSSFFAFISFNKTDNFEASNTFIAAQDTLIQNQVLLSSGGQLTQPINLQGQYNFRTLVSFGIPIKLLSSNLNLNTSITRGNTPGSINEQLNLVKNTGFSQGVVLASNISEKVDFTVSYNGSYNIVKNTLQPELDNNYYIQTTKLKSNFIFGKNFVLRTNLNYQKYSGLNDEFNEDFLLWNASVGKKFLKDNKGELSLSVFDILGENISLSRTVTETYLEDSRNQVLQTYFMLNFMYNIRNY